MAGDGNTVKLTTTVDQYAMEHKITAEQAIKELGLPQDVNKYQIFTFEEIPQGGYRTVESKMDTFKSSQRVQDLEVPKTEDPKVKNTKYINDKRREFKRGDVIDKFVVGLEVFVTHPTDFLNLFE